MPLFEFECRECHHVSEVLVRGANEPIACEVCGSPKVDKTLSRIATPAVLNRTPLPVCGPQDSTCARHPCVDQRGPCGRGGCKFSD
jgi:putative FmdB family regulatory protein